MAIWILVQICQVLAQTAFARVQARQRAGQLQLTLPYFNLYYSALVGVVPFVVLAVWRSWRLSRGGPSQPLALAANAAAGALLAAFAIGSLLFVVAHDQQLLPHMPWWRPGFRHAALLSSH